MGPELSQILKVQMDLVYVEGITEYRKGAWWRVGGTIRCKLYNVCKLVGNVLIINTVLSVFVFTVYPAWYKGSVRSSGTQALSKFIISVLPSIWLLSSRFIHESR